MTTVLVAANGGHLAQLVDLVPRLRPLGDDRLWVTPPGLQSDSLLRDARRVQAPPVAERDVFGVLRTARLAARLFRRLDVEAVVSTGSGIALGFLPLAATLGIPAFYIESCTFVAGPSVTGRLLQRTPRVRLFAQHSNWAVGRWGYAGSVLDGFTAVPGEGCGEPRRVLVTLGSDRWSFRRLVDRLIRILPPEAEVTWQVGTTPVEDLAIEASAYFPAAELQTAMVSADVVVAHAGCGSAMSALKAGKVPVLVPRDPTQGEVIDWHQRAFAEALATRGLAVTEAVEHLEFEDLQRAARLRAVRSTSPQPFELVPKLAR
jgi:UDP-N-acetylglucosamine transferase subunit ALG13